MKLKKLPFFLSIFFAFFYFSCSGLWNVEQQSVSITLPNMQEVEQSPRASGTSAAMQVHFVELKLFNANTKTLIASQNIKDKFTVETNGIDGVNIKYPKPIHNNETITFKNLAEGEKIYASLVFTVTIPNTGAGVSYKTIYGEVASEPISVKSKKNNITFSLNMDDEVAFAYVKDSIITDTVAHPFVSSSVPTKTYMVQQNGKVFKGTPYKWEWEFTPSLGTNWDELSGRATFEVEKKYTVIAKITEPPALKGRVLYSEVIDTRQSGSSGGGGGGTTGIVIPQNPELFVWNKDSGSYTMGWIDKANIETIQGNKLRKARLTGSEQKFVNLIWENNKPTFAHFTTKQQNNYMSYTVGLDNTNNNFNPTIVVATKSYPWLERLKAPQSKFCSYSKTVTTVTTHSLFSITQNGGTNDLSTVGTLPQNIQKLFFTFNSKTPAEVITLYKNASNYWKLRINDKDTQGQQAISGLSDFAMNDIKYIDNTLYILAAKVDSTTSQGILLVKKDNERVVQLGKPSANYATDNSTSEFYGLRTILGKKGNSLYLLDVGIKQSQIGAQVVRRIVVVDVTALQPSNFSFEQKSTKLNFSYTAATDISTDGSSIPNLNGL